jgi:hypothetical protein
LGLPLPLPLAGNCQQHHLLLVLLLLLLLGEANSASPTGQHYTLYRT